jgi:uncharacterized protein
VIIEPWRLPSEGESLVGDEPAEILHLEADAEVRPAAPVHYEVRVRLVGGELLVEGALQTRVRFLCSRCGVAFESLVRDAQFSADRAVSDRFQRVDLTPDVRESIILAFPTYPLCSPACRGLCPRCGADLNRETCRCTTPAGGGGDTMGSVRLD